GKIAVPRLRSRRRTGEVIPMFTDLPEEALRAHRTTAREPEGLDAFWAARLGEARALAEPPTAAEIETGLTAIRTWDVRFSGWGGQRIAGWLRAPAGATGPL